jgi:hypothetical protein
MRTAQPKIAVMIAESAPMSKSRMEQVGIRRTGVALRQLSASEMRRGRFSAHRLAPNLAEETGDGRDDDKPCEKPGERAETMVLERLSSA